VLTKEYQVIDLFVPTNKNLVLFGNVLVKLFQPKSAPSPSASSSSLTVSSFSSSSSAGFSSSFFSSAGAAGAAGTAATGAASACSNTFAISIFLSAATRDFTFTSSTSIPATSSTFFMFSSLISFPAL